MFSVTMAQAGGIAEEMRFESEAEARRFVSEWTDYVADEQKSGGAYRMSGGVTLILSFAHIAAVWVREVGSAT